MTLKYRAADGAELWESRYNGIGLSDRALAIAVDAIGDVYVTGITYQTVEMFATVRYRSSDGAELWVNVDDPGIHDLVTGLVVGGGGVFLSAVSDPDGDESNNNDNVYTARYDAEDGTTTWNAYYGENGHGDFDGGYAIARDGAGQVFTAGRTNSFGADSDILLLRYDEVSGEELQSAIYSGAGDFDTALRALISPAGSGVLGGITSTPAGDNDYIAISYPLPGGGVTADLDGDGTVGPQDLAMLLGSWGTCDFCSADLNQDGDVDAADVALLLGDWN